MQMKKRVHWNGDQPIQRPHVYVQYAVTDLAILT